VLRSNGRVLATSVNSLKPLVASLDGVPQWLQNSTDALSLPLIDHLLPLLYEWRLISRVANSEPEAPLLDVGTALPFDAMIDDRSYLCRLGLLSTPGFGGIIVTCFDHADFDNGAERLLEQAVVTTLVVLFSAGLCTVVLLRVVWRGVDDVTRFMSALEHASFGAPATSTVSDGTNIMRKMAIEWDNYLDDAVPQSCCYMRWCCSGDKKKGADEAVQLQNPKMHTNALNQPQARDTMEKAASAGAGDIELDVAGYLDDGPQTPRSLDQSNWLKPSLAASPPSGARAIDEILVNRSTRSDTCELFEPALMRRTFGGMLRSICSHQDEVERANEAKRHFIRYIFHEVRVPFNSVVLCTFRPSW